MMKFFGFESTERKQARAAGMNPDALSTLSGHTNLVFALAALPNGMLASGSSDNSIKLWDARGACVSTLSGHTNLVYALAALPNGMLASGSGDNSIKLWDVGCGPVLALREETADLRATTQPMTIDAGKAAREGGLDKKQAGGVAHNLPEAPVKSGGPAQSPLQAPPMMMTSNISEEDDFFECSDLPDRVGALSIPADKVKLGRELGKGGFGTVYEAKYNFQTVAVKCYEGSRLPERVAREIRHEVSIMLRLEHECLVRFLGLVQIDSHPAMLVMEYGANGSLYSYLHSEEEIPWGLRLRMAEELARGLAYLHQEKIVHRDIKSLNVVLDRDYHAKWCDFGLAQLKLHSTTTSKADASTGGSVAGTLHWMAPELFSRKSSTPSMPSDVWALGMVFFELASRQIPYKDAQTQQQVMAWIMSGEGEEVPDECQEQSPGFAQMMQRCWAERTARPTAEALSEELDVLNGGSSAPHTEKKASSPPKVEKAPDSGYAAFSRR